MKKAMSRTRKGVYVLPNLFTAMNLFCGFYSIIASINSDFRLAAISIFIAIVFDILDGKVARATNTSSRFGAEFDSLADLLSFGLAPALLFYHLALQPMGKFGWLAAFLFTVCGALRLARFNAMSDSSTSSDFTGLPIPGAAAMLASSAFFLCEHSLLNLNDYPLLVMLALYVLSFLMVSNIPYNSFKNHSLFRRFNFHALVACVLVLVFVAAELSGTLFFIALFYTLSGPLGLFSKLKSKKVVQDILEEE